MRILLTNTVVLNGGDAAIALGEIELLRNAFGKETDIILFDSQPEIAGRYYPYLTFRKLLYLNIAGSFGRKGYSGRWLRRANLLRFNIGSWCFKQNLLYLCKLCLKEEEIRDLTEYKNADLIISTGGTLLVENYNLQPRVFDFAFSLGMKKPLVFFTQSIGRFNNQRNRSCFKRIFDAALLIFVRDEKSMDNLLDIEVNNKNIFVAADAAFALADEQSLKLRIKEGYSLSPNPRVAISVRDWRFFSSVGRETGQKIYYECIKILAEHLIRNYNAKVTFISTCQGIPEYWTDDSKVADEIVKKMPDEVRSDVKVDSDFHAPPDLIKILKGYDLVVATRLHMAILALGVGVPVFPIAYEFKTEELFEKLGLERWVQNIEKLRADTIQKSFDSFLKAFPLESKKFFERVVNEREGAVKSADILKAHILRRFS
jgi:colanic acid/amylovoran biosynthesis protein